jgi:D-tyrosyl-tRNA(Tyr) deacylase
MRCVIQRVRSASVEVGGTTVSEIGSGMLVLAAVEKGDTDATMSAAAKKIRELRIFDDGEGRMNLDITNAGGAILAVSQFTLAGSIAKGRRPSFDRAEDPGIARTRFDVFVTHLGESGIAVRTGVFQAMMVVRLENDGPVTFVYDL